jgi:hypothetical protein
VLETIEHPDAPSMIAAEALALLRLDQYGARASKRMEALFPNLDRNGRPEMYDPLLWRGGLASLLSERVAEAVGHREPIAAPWGHRVMVTCCDEGDEKPRRTASANKHGIHAGRPDRRQQLARTGVDCRSPQRVESPIHLVLDNRLPHPADPLGSCVASADQAHSPGDL